MTAPESSRQRFLRNHQENLGVMKVAAVRAERDGRVEDAGRIREIIASWEGIAQVARSQEEGEGPDADALRDGIA
jgi:hypothetical protein